MAYYAIYSMFYDYSGLLDTSSGVQLSDIDELTNYVELTKERYDELLAAQCQGQRIVIDASCNVTTESQDYSSCDCLVVPGGIIMRNESWSDTYLPVRITGNTYEHTPTARLEMRINDEGSYAELIVTDENNADAGGITISHQEGDGQTHMRLQADELNLTSYTPKLNGTLIYDVFPRRLRANDTNKLIQLEGNTKIIDGFDPKDVIANILIGKGYGSATIFGEVGSIALLGYYVYDTMQINVGDNFSGSDLFPVTFYDSMGSIMRNSSYEMLDGVWTALTSSYYASSGETVIFLAVRTM